MNNLLNERLNELKKTAFDFQIKPVPPSDYAGLVSSFGTDPYMLHNETWPLCTICQNELDHVCQLDFKGLDPGLKFQYLVFFYCMECTPLGSDENEGRGYLFRTYKKADEKNWAPGSRQAEQVTQPCTITFARRESLPDWHGIKSIAPDIAEHFNQFEEAAEDKYEDLVDDLIDGHSFSFLFGYPQFIEEDITPRCDECSNRMRLLVQLDSEDEADLVWGNSGCAYLFYCEEHQAGIKLRIQF